VFKEGDSDREDNNKKEDESGEEDDEDDVIGEEGNVDDAPHKKNTNRKHRRTPIKARWLVPLIKSRLRERPNISNKECSHILRLHVRQEFLTKAVLQNAKMEGRFEVFGNPTENAHFIPAML
jgi:hypothetical protein